jgi:curved DNA-binding protein CbpA
MNYYEILGVAPDSSTEEIERAFRKVARQVHPDLNGDVSGKSEARMKQLNEIRDTLTDPLLRAGYDERLRLERQRDQGSHPAPAAAPASQPAPPTPRDIQPQPAPGRGAWFVLVLGASLTSALLWHWRHELQSSPAPTPAGPASAPPAEPSAPPATVQAPVPAPAPAPAPSAPRRKRVVRLGSSVDEVFAAFGTPDRIEPGRQSGDAVFHYGRLHLEIRNGRVTGGDAAVFR